jgi:hypothetical protein
VIQHILMVRRGPSVRQQTVQRLGAGVRSQLQDHVIKIGPRLDPVPLRSRNDRVDHRSPCYVAWLFSMIMVIQAALLARVFPSRTDIELK